MTIEQKAREIAESIATHTMEDAARLGIIEGLEIAAKVAEQWNENSPYSSRAAAIRALIGDMK